MSAGLAPAGMAASFAALAHEAADFGILLPGIDHGQTVARRQGNDLIATNREEGIGADQ